MRDANIPAKHGLDELEEIDRICDAFEASWQMGGTPDLKAFLERATNQKMKQRLFAELLAVDVECRKRNGVDLDNSVILQEFRELRQQENTLTAEAYLRLRGIESDRRILAELLHEELILRLESCQDYGLDVTQTLATATRPDKDVRTKLPSNLGRYVIRSLISEGGFGSVYRAEDPNLGREVAIKSPRLDRPLNDEGKLAFEQEARLICKLEHQNILPVYDFGMTENGRPFLVCKLVNANSLATKMKKGGVNFHEATRIVSAIAHALHHAHRHGTVHRDVKPGNILLEDHGHAWLADFGLGLQGPKTELSSDSSGTPRYWSPEQAESKAHLVDGRSDIFSLGIVLYELITHVHPFEDATIAGLLKRILAADVRPPRQLNDRIPRKLEEACLRALRRNPNERYSTAADLAEDLEQVATYQPRPIDTSQVELSPELTAIVERLAENTHEIWAQKRISEGWIVGESRDDKKLTHPDLVPYEQLSPIEQDYDRTVVRSILEAAIALGCRIDPARVES